MNCAASHSFRKSVYAGVLLVVVLLLPGMVLAQSYRGAIRGEVFDPSGAVVANATVTVKGSANGITRVVSSGPDGVFIVSELPAGQYDVTVEAAGFQKPTKTAG